ncbi:MAG: TonB-dependent receptor [Bacteroidales bacterium]|jgi:TonB-linked SusC/RagA family outer membrane protein|nr:TonB-dependent receptor [Bacteroidales bacterium]
MKIYKIIALVICSLFCSFTFAQTKVKVSGVVTDTNNETLVNVTVFPRSEPTRGLTTDANGRYNITVNVGETLVFSYVGFAIQEKNVGSAETQTIDVVLEESSQELEEVSIVGYGTQRKVSVLASISTIKPSELQIGGVSSVSNSLAGRIAGLIGVQTSGEPGSDVTEFWIRGMSTFGGGSAALILIDGIDRGSSALNDLAPEDIESFSILKDATATAIYGARGANGVILINTKRGQEGKISVNANVKTSVETLPRLPKYLRAHDYTLLANEARVVRGDLPLYSDEVFDILKYKMDPDLYPDVSWQDEILRDRTWAVQGNVNISGGGKLARYYMSGFYRTNDAIYKQDGMKQYHSNVRRNQYSFRSNIDVNVTPSTRVSLLLSAKLIDQNRPGKGETAQIWNSVAKITPMTVPIMYSNGQFPSYGEGNETSPTILLNETGYRTDRDNSIETLLTIEQELGMLIDGLKVSGSISFDNFNNHIQTRYKMPDLYMAVDRNWQTGELLTTKTVVASPMSYGTSSYGTRTIYMEGRINYDKIIKEKHRLGALFLYQQKDYQQTNINDELYSIPRRNQGIAGRFTYSYNDIYFVEGNFGYNGSENFPKGQRFGFFPSVALGYVVSNYQFMRDNFPFINMLKLRYSFGLVGNDKITSDDVRFPYLTEINMSATGSYFGDVASLYGGVTDSKLGSTGLVWETAKKHNWGIDLMLWNSTVNITVDAFLDRRDNIFMARNTLPGTLGIGSTIWGNVGKMRSWGSDGTASYTKRFGDFTVEVRGNFTFSRNKILDYDEVTPRYPYLEKKGQMNEITRGLIALGLFKDEEDVRNSPTQFGKVLPGDIKYQDVNGDGVIDSYDIVPIGNATVPRIQYGFAGSLMWKGIDFNIFFRGSGKSDYFMGGDGYYPFSGEKTGNVLTIVNDQENRWTPASYSGDPSTENPNARFPRLTYGHNVNNNRNSTFWLANASYLRLKTLEVGYTLPKRWSQKVAMSNLRISLIGDNLHVWDKVKLWDPEQASSNGAVYPLTRSYTLVLQMSF